MNREDIIRMAREAGDADRIDPFTKDGDWVILTPDELERFAALVASAEREACAKVCEEDDSMRWSGAANVIRARGQA
ncbi:hypothetical protein UFOVP173_46 [uncultured Caudovirales phage]|uniref:Uncharacterized protein n=1 Tax=uncultured Caudovirales phage TaxID=2100421 RepID=A0A6J7WFF1_9CAUD|nr:hypothetical protein UFOVP173_46 [uncultured Caudovirales phage]